MEKSNDADIFNFEEITAVDQDGNPITLSDEQIVELQKLLDAGQYELFDASGNKKPKVSAKKPEDSTLTAADKKEIEAVTKALEEEAEIIAASQAAAECISSDEDVASSRDKYVVFHAIIF